MPKSRKRPPPGRQTAGYSAGSAPGDKPKPERLDTTLARRYHLTRLVIASVMVVVSVVLVLAWNWSAGLFVTTVAVWAGIDARMRYEGRWSQSAWLPLLVDSTAVGVATVFGQLPVEVTIAPFSYIVVSLFALLQVRRALWLLPYPVSWMLIHFFVVHAGDWSGTELLVIRIVALVTYLPGMVAILVAASQALQSANISTNSSRRAGNSSNWPSLVRP